MIEFLWKWIFKGRLAKLYINKDILICGYKPKVSKRAKSLILSIVEIENSA